MLFIETALKGSFILELDRLEDDRGFFARSFCAREFQERGLEYNWVQCNISYNRTRGTLRGMHYQARPDAEAKLVRCTSGSIYDVIVDLRRNSLTYKKWVSVQLSSENHRLLYIPKDFAHGFLTLKDSVEVFYQMSEFYAPNSVRGIRWDDPALSISWPELPSHISRRDEGYPPFTE